LRTYINEDRFFLKLEYLKLNVPNVIEELFEEPFKRLASKH
jgi:hypothetical protein